MKIIIVMGPIPTKRGRGIERRRNRLQIRGNKTERKLSRRGGDGGHFYDGI